MIDLKSRMFGSIQVSEEHLVHMPGGLIGFEEYRRYALIEADDLKPLVWLVSVEEPELAFPLADPSFFAAAYEVPVHPEDREALDIQSADELITYVIVTLPDATRPLTANLRGPVLMNLTNRMARQLVLVNDSYSHRQVSLADSANLANRE